MEFKTLKDFESHIEESIHNRLCKDLRQEAIKWIKSPCPSNNDSCLICGGKDLFIRHFFNITDEDLK